MSITSCKVSNLNIMRSIPSYACAHKPQPLCPAKIRGNPNESDVTVKVIFFSSRFALLFRGKLWVFFCPYDLYFTAVRFEQLEHHGKIKSDYKNDSLAIFPIIIPNRMVSFHLCL